MLQYTGYLLIPATGEYTLSITSDDGSFLYVDGVLVADNGGPHGDVTVSGTLTLAAGLHGIRQVAEKTALRSCVASSRKTHVVCN